MSISSGDAAAMLSGVRVIDLTTVVFGPLTTQILADYGADVIKVESPEGDIMRFAGDGAKGGMGPIFINLNRGKRSVVVDLKTAGGKQILQTLLTGADVVVHNIRRQAIDRLGFSYEAVGSFNPRILYCVASGFANGSRRADAAAIDDVIQTASGLAALNAGDDCVPRLVQSLIADKVSALALACSILAALYRRAKTGCGGSVDVPMYETVAAFMLLEHLQGHTFRPAVGEIGYRRVMQNGRRIYRARDGHISMAPYSTAQWMAFFQATGRPALANDPRITDPVQRNAHVSALYDLIGDVAGERTVSEWEALAEKIGFPAQRVNTLAEVVSQADLESTGTLVARNQPGVGEVNMLASPGFFDGRPARHAAAAPRLGEHTAQVLVEAGVSLDELDRFAAEGVIRLRESSNE